VVVAITTQWCTSLEFEQYYKDEGIVRHKTIVYNPQQNSVYERMNQTRMD